MTKVKNNEIKFLETISSFGNDILIPINRIVYISLGYVTGWEIKIISDNDGELIECFGNDEDKAYARYNIIKKIIKGL